MSNSFNNSGIIVNPILSTFPADEINIQPYWLVVLGLFASQLCQRIWHYFKYKTLFTTLEIAGLIRIFQNRLAKKNAANQSVPVAFAEKSATKSTSGDSSVAADQERLATLRSTISIDYFDAVNCLLILGHAIWYCVIQSKCINSSSSIATPWNCYNALGYRLFNYVFVSYFSTALDCVYKTYMLGFHEILKVDAKKGSCRWTAYYATLIIIALSLLFTTCLMLPFVLTNVIPMFFVYIWMSIIYIGVCIYLVYSSFRIYRDFKQMPAKIQKKDVTEDKDSDQLEYCSFMFTAKEIPQVAASMLLAMVITTFPILLAIFYNYTQYFYYGETYLRTIEDEYKSRDTINYLNVLVNSAQQSLHLALNFL